MQTNKQTKNVTGMNLIDSGSSFRASKLLLLEDWGSAWLADRLELD